jgi:hypothetical protein
MVEKLKSLKTQKKYTLKTGSVQTLFGCKGDFERYYGRASTVQDHQDGLSSGLKG